MNTVAGEPPAGRGLALALLIVLPLYLLGTCGHDLWRPAEPREAGIAREMLESGNWVATHLNGHLFLEKPPLYTWTLALSLHLFGFRDWAVRIPVVLFALGTLATTYFLARQRLGIYGARWSLVSLASMWLFLEVNHGAMVDNGLVFFTTLTMLAFYRLDASGRRAWAAVFYAGLGLAFLCKGFIGPALVLAAVGAWLVVRRGPWPWRAWRLPGLALTALLAGGWLAALWWQGGVEYFRVFFVENHLQRFLGNSGPVQPWFYYLPLLPLAALPWTFVLPAGCWVAWQQRREAGPAAWLFWQALACWLGAMLVVLSVPGGKDNQYILPLLPPLAVACGAWVEWTSAGRPAPAWGRVLTWILVLAMALVMTAAPLAIAWYAGTLGWGAWLLAALLAAASTAAWQALRRQRWRAAWACLALLIMGSSLTLKLFLQPVMNAAKTTKPLVGLLQAHLPPGTGLWGYDLTENTEGALVFYGWRPRRLATLADAARLAQADAPAAILLTSRDRRHEFRDHVLATGQWRLLLNQQVGGRYYWLLANPAVPGT